MKYLVGTFPWFSGRMKAGLVILDIKTYSIYRKIMQEITKTTIILVYNVSAKSSNQSCTARTKLTYV
jgi:hypothetical protein